MLIENTGDIRLGVMANEAVASLKDKIKFLPTLNMGFDVMPGQRDNEYFMTVIDEGAITARERINDNDDVVDDQAGATKIGITTNQIYTSSTFGQKFLDSVNAKWVSDWVGAQTNVLVRKIEEFSILEFARKKAIALAAGAIGSNDTLGGTDTDILYSDFQAAKLAMDESKQTGMRNVILSARQMQNAIELGDFKTALALNQSAITGEPQSGMYGFDPISSILVPNRNPYPSLIAAPIAGVLAANIADTTVTTFTVSGLPAIAASKVGANPDDDNAIRAGQVMQINAAEIRLVHTVTYTSTTEATVTAKRGWNGSTPATATAGDAAVVIDSKTGLFYRPSELVYAFVEQASFNDARGEKATARDPESTLYLSIFKEPVEKKNGMWRYVVSVDLGFNVIRPSAIIPVTLPQ